MNKQSRKKLIRKEELNNIKALLQHTQTNSKHITEPTQVNQQLSKRNNKRNDSSGFKATLEVTESSIIDSRNLTYLGALHNYN